MSICLALIALSPLTQAPPEAKQIDGLLWAMTLPFFWHQKLCVTTCFKPAKEHSTARSLADPTAKVTITLNYSAAESTCSLGSAV